MSWHEDPPCSAQETRPAQPSSARPEHLQTRLLSQASLGARQEGGSPPSPEKAQAGTKVWRRRSAHAGLVQGQKSSAWVSACGPREKKRRRARWQREREHLPCATRPRHCATYSVRSRWHSALAVHASAASTQRFPAAELADPGGGAGRLQFSVHPKGTFHPGRTPRNLWGARDPSGDRVGTKSVPDWHRPDLVHGVGRAAASSGSFCHTLGIDGMPGGWSALSAEAKAHTPQVPPHPQLQH